VKGALDAQAKLNEVVPSMDQIVSMLKYQQKPLHEEITKLSRELDLKAFESQLDACQK
jgi:hypothetical protein